jgi:hypothetical protein
MRVDAEQLKCRREILAPIRILIKQADPEKVEDGQEAIPQRVQFSTFMGLPAQRRQTRRSQDEVWPPRGVGPLGNGVGGRES